VVRRLARTANFIAEADELRFRAIALQHTHAVDEGPHNASEKSSW